MNFQYLTMPAAKNSPKGRQIAVRCSQGTNPGLVWLGGYRSDMLGGKAMALQNWANENGHACCRFDYSGHGESISESEDDFMIGTISRWVEESLAVFNAFTTGPQILIGSSMGCWIALRMAQELAKQGQNDRLHAMVLIAPAPDFTKELTWPNFTEAQRKAVIENGYMEEATDDPLWKTVFTKALFDDGEKNLVLDGEVKTGCPVHIIQGGMDDVVPLAHAQKLSEQIPHDNVTMTIIKDGDHRLSREQDIEVILNAVKGVSLT